MIKKLFTATLPLLITFIIHMILWKGFDIYSHFTNIDFIEHGIGGLVTAWTIYNLIKLGTKEWHWKIQPNILLYFFIVGGVMLVATLWEFHEFTHDVLFPDFPPYQLGQWDTMHDYLMALIGAMAFCVAHRLKKGQACG